MCLMFYLRWPNDRQLNLSSFDRLIWQWRWFAACGCMDVTLNISLNKLWLSQSWLRVEIWHVGVSECMVCWRLNILTYLKQRYTAEFNLLLAYGHYSIIKNTGVSKFSPVLTPRRPEIISSYSSNGIKYWVKTKWTPYVFRVSYTFWHISVLSIWPQALLDV